MFEALQFPTELRPLVHPMPMASKMHEIPGRKALIRTDTGEVLNIVSDRYHLVTHLELMTLLHRTIEETGIGIQSVEVGLGGRGAQAQVRWRLDRKIQVGPDDEVSLEVVARNSYDYSRGVGLLLGGYRLICSNGLVIGRTLGRFNKRHTASLAGGAAAEQAVRKVLAHQTQVSDQWQRWREIDYQPQRLAQWMETEAVGRMGKKRQEEVVDYYTVQPDREDRSLPPSYNGWEAYNALTWAATHRVRTRSVHQLLSAQAAAQDLAQDFAATLG